VIDQTCTQPWVTPDGAQVLVPLRDRMREVRDYVFQSEPTAPVGDGATQVVIPTPTPEVATVAVLNGTMRSGLAGATADVLREGGIDVALVGNADRQDYEHTLVVLNRDKPQTASKVLQILGLAETAMVQGEDPGGSQDVVIVLGADFETPAQP
jgi:hypothetical protein